MRIKYGAQVVPGGALIASQPNIVTLTLADGSLFSTGAASLLASTDADGFWEYTWVPTGSAAAGWILNPPPMLWSLTYNGQTRKGNTKAGGVVGSISLLELPELTQIYGEGVVAGAVAGDFAVTWDSAGTDLDIAAGYAIVRGVGVTNPSSRELELADGDATHPRIDTVVLELVRAAGNTEGRVTLKVVAGTPAASPVAPTLTQNTTTWQYPLADARVNAGATVVASVTDRRTYPAVSQAKTAAQMPVLRTAPGATALTTTPTAIAALEHSITLASGVWYDIFIWADVEVSSDGFYYSGMSSVMAIPRS